MYDNYVTSFATYLNRGVNLADFQSSGNIPLAKELLNVVEIMWGAIKSAQSIISWLYIPSGPAPSDLLRFLKRDNTWLLSVGMNLESFFLKAGDI